MRRRIGWLAALVALGSAVPWGAEDSAGDGRAFAPVRHDENWGFLADPVSDRQPLDGIKYLPLGDDAFATLGGEARLQFESYDNLDFDDDPRLTDGYLLWRFMLHGDFRVGERARAFVHLQSGLVSDQSLPNGPADRNDVDVHEAFFEWDFGKTRVRAGRQELRYGSQRLLAVREGPNIRRSYDVVKLMTDLGRWQLDTFIARPVRKRPESFDDDAEGSRTFWSAYATRPLSRGEWDVYYIGLQHDDARFQAGQADERRHSIGSRLAFQGDRWDVDAEAVVQWGTFGDDDILAWTATADTGFRTGASAEGPRLGLRTSLISGDRSRSGTLSTFNALFPRGNYFGESALVGPANLVAIHPNLGFSLGPVNLEVSWDFYWRYSTTDGLYGPGGNLIVPGDEDAGREIGNEASLVAEWRASRLVSLGSGLSYFATGRFLERSDRNDVTYAMFFATFKF